MPSNYQWESINDFVILLKPFESLTIQISSEQRPTLAKVIPLLRGADDEVMDVVEEGCCENNDVESVEKCDVFVE
ncbi:zinc finger BED domain-containing protein 1-like isoform X2, partial [Aphis craccivora]